MSLAASASPNNSVEDTDGSTSTLYNNDTPVPFLNIPFMLYTSLIPDPGL